MKKVTILFLLSTLFVLGACKDEPVNNDNPSEEPALTNVYSVGADKTVSIATGNLQYQASSHTWRIAPNAWDGTKEINLGASEYYDGWIDLFGWATSGYNDYYPYLSSPSSGNYYHDADLAGTEYDWGVHNAIANGNSTDPAGTWRTLTREEWDYLLFQRDASTLNSVPNARFALATVANQPGMILFPDTFVMPESLNAPDVATINTHAPYENNNYNPDNWAALEEAGCVFLPALGCKNVASTSLVASDYLGCYWSATLHGVQDNTYHASQLWFNPNMVEMGSAGLQYSRSVRLAKDLH